MLCHFYAYKMASWLVVGGNDGALPSINKVIDPFFFMYPLADARCRGGLFWLGDLRLCG